MLQANPAEEETSGVSVSKDGSLKLKFDGYAITLIVIFVV